jgi:hypothetical protein
MCKTTKIVLLFVVLNGIMFTTLADRGVGKSKRKVNLNSITNNLSYSKYLSLNLRTGLKYTGSLLYSTENSKRNLVYNTLVTYQKGNIIYIVPYKQKIIVPEIRNGYTGMKLILKAKN